MIRLLFKPLLFFIVLLVIGLCSVLFLEQHRSLLFKIPIAVEDRDQSASSSNWIATIKESEAIDLQRVDEQFLEAKELVQMNEAAVALVIPEGYDEQLKQLQLKKTIELYRADGIVATIATEVVSRALYEQQIPFVIKKHVNKDADFTEIKRVYEENQPHNQLKKVAFIKNMERPNYGLSIALVATFLLLISQLLFFNKLRQFQTLKRMAVYPFAKLKLASIYTISLVIACTVVLSILCFIYDLPFATIHLFVWLLLYQIITTCIVFRMKTTSHALFIVVFWSLGYSAFYIINQLIGGSI
ncbi:MAG: ABC transporter permease [Kurthia sp.]|nr:ABC transporter permease [Candidatus Kurthia equi]